MLTISVAREHGLYELRQRKDRENCFFSSIQINNTLSAYRKKVYDLSFIDGRLRTNNQRNARKINKEFIIELKI